MKKIFEQTDSGYSWSNRHTYYLCESDEEYEKMVEKYKDHVNSWKVWDDLLRCYVLRSNHKQVTINTSITARPQTVVSDGFASYGGKDFKAKGITIKYCSSGLSTDYSSYEHFVKPGTIETDETAKTENWWV